MSDRLGHETSIEPTRSSLGPQILIGIISAFGTGAILKTYAIAPAHNFFWYSTGASLVVAAIFCLLQNIFLTRPILSDAGWTLSGWSVTTAILGCLLLC